MEFANGVVPGEILAGITGWKRLWLITDGDHSEGAWGGLGAVPWGCGAGEGAQIGQRHPPKGEGESQEFPHTAAGSSPLLHPPSARGGFCLSLAAKEPSR